MIDVIDQHAINTLHKIKTISKKCYGVPVYGLLKKGGFFTKEPIKKIWPTSFLAYTQR